MNNTKGPNRRGSRRPSGPNGEVRDQLIALRFSQTELDQLYAFLKRRGLPATPAGVRTLLLETVAAGTQGDTAAPEFAELLAA